jgi:hypothetical protein
VLRKGESERGRKYVCGCVERGRNLRRVEREEEKKLGRQIEGEERGE